MKEELWDARVQMLNLPNGKVGESMQTIKEYLQIRYIEERKSMAKISAEICCSYSTVRIMLEKRGFEVREGNHKEPLLIPMKELRSLTIDELAAKYKKGRTTVWRIKQLAFPKKDR